MTKILREGNFGVGDMMVSNCSDETISLRMELHQSMESEDTGGYYVEFSSHYVSGGKQSIVTGVTSINLDNLELIKVGINNSAA